MGGAVVRENQSDIAALQAGLKARKPARDGLRLYTAPPTFESVSLCGFYRGRSAFLMLSGPSLKQIDLSLLDVMVSSLSYFAVDHLASGRVPQRTGSRNPVTHPSGIYACRDGRIMIIAGNDEQFRRLCGVLELPALADDPRFTSSPLRVANRVALDSIVEPVIAHGQRWVDPRKA